MWYWASPIEARMCRDEEVVLVGGGNSAGQAAVFLSGFAAKVWMLVRGDGLAETMSRYLIDRIAATPNIEFHPLRDRRPFRTPENRLERVRWRQPDGRKPRNRSAMSFYSSARIRPRSGSRTAASSLTEPGSCAPGPRLRWTNSQ